MLTLYRRHSADCPVLNLPLPAKAKRLYMDCECPLWMCGRTDTAAVPRQSTGLTDLKAAEALRASLVADGKDQIVHGPRLAECAEKYLASREHGICLETSKHHRLLLSRLQKYCEAHGVYFARELTVDLLEQFKTDGFTGLADASKSFYLSKLRCFLKDAFRRGWITDSLALKLTTYSIVHEQKSPYTDTEVEKILGGALLLKRGSCGYAKRPATLRLLLELMLATGMRCGDAVRYDPSAAIKGEYMWVYTFQPQKQKKGRKLKTVESYLPDALKTAIDGCEWMSTALPFYYGDSKDRVYLAHEVYRNMQTIGARCGVPDCRPHRLRDTFAVRKLLSGLQLDDVSRLLGHSSVKVTEMYYAKWVSGRKLRLERLVAESFMNT